MYDDPNDPIPVLGALALFGTVEGVFVLEAYTKVWLLLGSLRVKSTESAST
jgi:hypothetical protein